jgi:hypothetical protein
MQGPQVSRYQSLCINPETDGDLFADGQRIEVSTCVLCTERVRPSPDT